MIVTPPSLPLKLKYLTPYEMSSLSTLRDLPPRYYTAVQSILHE